MIDIGQLAGIKTRALRGLRSCIFRESFAGQALGIKEVEEGIWLVSFMEYDLG
jgi:hypothetical protein